MSETTYHIENAKSGRSSCKKCKEKIGKGEFRIGVTSPGPNDYNITSWYHPKCYSLGRKLKKEGVTPTSFVQELLQDNTDDQVLREKEAKFIADIEAGATAGGTPGKSKAGGKGGGGGQSAADVMALIKEAAKKKLEKGEEEEEGPKRKKQKKADVKKEGKSASGEVDDAMVDAYNSTFRGMSNDELKDVLRWNKQMVSGTKDELTFRCLDGSLHGRFAPCPSCEKGRLKLKPAAEHQTVMCNGWYDEDNAVRHSCLFTCQRLDAPRNQPWYDREPTEEEKEAMEKEREGGGGTKGKDAMETLLPKFKKLTWDLSSQLAIKHTTESIMDLLRDTELVNLPSKKTQAKMEVGKLLLSHRSSTPKEILQAILDKFGIKKSAKEEQAKQEAMANICAHSANGPLYEAFAELAKCYYQESNRNAGTTYTKVAAAIKELDFEVTEENAKGLGKGKTKIENVGKGSAEKMYEFVTTGKIAKLEEKRGVTA